MKGVSTALCGESGCGKTTTAMCLAGLLTPDSGSIVINDNDVLTLKSADRRALLRSTFQMIFQDTLDSLHPVKTVKKIFNETLIYLHKSNPKKIPDIKKMDDSELLKIYHAILEKVDIPKDALDNLPDEFSGGEIQRICIARALIARPDFLIADEPVSCLDVTTQAKVLNLLRNIVKFENMGLLLISHDLAAAHYICDNVIIMEKGLKCDMGNVEDIFNINARVTDYTKKLLKGMMFENSDEF
ncbi:MAG: dipeptide/oligopeptide/nickel ABC transporter ATP-binding protein [Saprospiraceae bacterium]|nr:dipeptide/oligopeptide/nickel ABC transporter ATP-binding protein [Saprospiraceae bacterium]